MLNEELQYVFNLSDHQNHRYNGHLLSTPAVQTILKAKKINSKKKLTEMVTSASKPVLKRRYKSKNSITKAENVILNGVNNVGNIFFKTKELQDKKYRTIIENNLNNKYERSCFDTLNAVTPAANSTKNVDGNMNSRVRLLNVKYQEMVEQEKSLEFNRNYSKNHANNSMPNELVVKLYSNKFTHQKINNTSTVSRMKINNDDDDDDDDNNVKADKYSSFLDDTSNFKEPLSNSQYESFIGRNEPMLGDCQPSNETVGEKNLATVASNKSCESKLFLRAKKRKQNGNKWQMNRGTRHEALQRIRECVNLQENLQNDLYPLNLGETGYEKSDNDSSEEYSSTFQKHWFHSRSEIEFDDVKRNLRLSQLFNELRRQLYQIKQNKNQLPTLNDNFMKSLVGIVRTRPTDAKCCLIEEGIQKSTIIEPLILAKKKCAMELCKNVALPCMPTCVRHVLLCDKQMLFEQCRVKDSNNFQCDRPVMNVKYHYPVCSLHSKPDFVLPDFSRREINFEDVRRKNVYTVSANTYKTDTDFLNASTHPINCPSLSSKTDAKKCSNATSNFVIKQQPCSRPHILNEMKEKENKVIERMEDKAPKKEEVKVRATVLPEEPTEATETNIEGKAKAPQSVANENDPNLMRDWVTLSETPIVDGKTLESTSPSDFVNGFDINSTSIQSQIQDIINSESSLSTDMLMESNELPSYIQVEEMIEEVEITDEGLDSSELGNQELVHSEDLNAVLKQLPPEAFNELFSEFTLSER